MFQGDPNLRSLGEKIEYDEFTLKEFIRCREDILYFAQKYFYIKTIDAGEILIPLFEYQKKVLKALFDPEKLRILLLMPRQYSKTTLVSIFICHFILFNSNKNCAVLANKDDTAKEILDRIKYAYQRFPLWLQQGIAPDGWNAKSLKLENDSKVETAPTSKSGISGKSIALLYIDEVAKIEAHIAGPFFDSVFPVVSSSKTGKVIMSSTPVGLNIWFDFWDKAVKGLSEYFPIRVHWYERKDRDENWKKKIISEKNLQYWLQEYECKFLGSSTTLIDGEFLEQLQSESLEPIEVRLQYYFNIYEHPIKGQTYVLGVDTAKGTGKNASCIQVLKYESKTKITEVAVYNNNKIPTTDFSQICIEISKYYNEAPLMIENNAEGAAVCDAIWYQHEYDKIINLDPKGLGIRSTKTTKLAGNLILRDYIHNKWLKIVDKKTITELSRYEEQQGKLNVFSCGMSDDDCVTSLLWAVYFFETPYFDGVDDSGGAYIKEKNKVDDNIPGIYLDNGGEQTITFDEETLNNDFSENFANLFNKTQ